MPYTHIFTDGTDKLLSASIWFKWYGGNDAFCYYQDGALRGYVSNAEYQRLNELGASLLTNQQFVNDLVNDATTLELQLANLTKKFAIGTASVSTLNEIATLLETSYKKYFYTEEYYTNGLLYSTHQQLIEDIGKFRFSYVKTCIQATELVHDIASKIMPEHNSKFLTIDEVKQQKSTVNTNEREIAFLLVQKNQKLTLTEGTQATEGYEKLISQTTTNDLPSTDKTIQGTGASKGNVSGLVYLISLVTDDLSSQIEKMPQGSILVTESTQPQMIIACNKAAAIIANEGGVLSHAAIVARELKIPCVVGTRNATEMLKNGDEVSVDGESGIVTIIKKGL